MLNPAISPRGPKMAILDLRRQLWQFFSSHTRIP
jgi:hypothetical protein